MVLLRNRSQLSSLALCYQSKVQSLGVWVLQGEGAQNLQMLVYACRSLESLSQGTGIIRVVAVLLRFGTLYFG